MNDGKIIVHGSIGDTAGYAMRGGEIYVKGNAGYRAGIHMKEYEGKNSELSRKGGKIRMQIKQKQKPVFSENVKSECLRCAKLDTCSVRNVKWD